MPTSNLTLQEQLLFLLNKQEIAILFKLVEQELGILHDFNLLKKEFGVVGIKDAHFYDRLKSVIYSEVSPNKKGVSNFEEFIGKNSKASNNGKKGVVYYVSIVFVLIIASGFNLNFCQIRSKGNNSDNTIGCKSCNNYNNTTIVVPDTLKEREKEDKKEKKKHEEEEDKDKNKDEKKKEKKEEVKEDEKKKDDTLIIEKKNIKEIKIQLRLPKELKECSYAHSKKIIVKKNEVLIDYDNLGHNIGKSIDVPLTEYNKGFKITVSCDKLNYILEIPKNKSIDSIKVINPNEFEKK